FCNFFLTRKANLNFIHQDKGKDNFFLLCLEKYYLLYILVKSCINYLNLGQNENLTKSKNELKLENNPQIYVNQGFGFLGYTGRIGVRPEISVITLQSKK
ncbi:MAG: hypothetical protein KGZ97_00400, partial [Bacteroidetes bacterium]|nr:hypothetical protein [Bacteroidota bacterium]